jgi:hypothetical protein
MTADELDRNLMQFMENAVIKYAHRASQPLWETDEQWQNNSVIGLNWPLILDMCKLPLVRTCVQYAMAFEAGERAAAVEQLMRERRENSVSFREYFP